jgi:putative ABC transport system permease protein
MSETLQNLRYSFRLLGRSPGFTAAAVLTLALGIGANAAIFSVVNSVLLAPLPYRDPQRLVAIYSRFNNQGFEHFWISPPEYLELRRMAASFEDVGGFRNRAVNVSGGERPLRVAATYVTASALSTLGLPAERGRWFSAAEDQPNAEAVVVLGDDLWRRAFAADPGLLGRRVRVDGVDRTVVGIMPAGAQIGGERVEAWLPLRLGPLDPRQRGDHFLNLVARLRPGVGLRQARAELAGLVRRWQDLAGAGRHAPDPRTHPLVIVPLLDDLVGEARPALRLLWGAVALVLLIACANVANLQLARAEARQREIAVRAALGAGHGRLLRQFLTESLLLALLGGGLGLLLAAWGVRALVAARPDGIPRLGEIGIDWRSLAVTFLVSVASGVAFGLAPALHARAGSFAGTLKEGGLRATAGAARQRLRRALVVAEITLAAMLVIGGGLLLRSFWQLQQVDPGFEARGLLTMEVSLPPASYPGPAQVAGFVDRLSERLAALPGVEAAAAMSGLPPRRDLDANDMVFEGMREDPHGPRHNADFWQFVTRDYFRTMRIPLVAGRDFTAQDGARGAGVAVVNETMARTFWPGRDPVGRRIKSYGRNARWLTIVGVAHDVKQQGLEQKPGTEIYFLESQVPATAVDSPPSTFHLVLRCARDPLRLAGAARAAVHGLDPSLPVAHVETMDRVVGQSLGRPRFVTLLVLLFAAVALALAAVGTYSVLAYSVEQRTQEIGVRMALGAEVRGILAMVLRQGLVLAGAGLGLGLTLALALRRLLASVLFGVSPTDPATFAGVAALLALVAAAACYLPARRAAAIAPAVALRHE